MPRLEDLVHLGRPVEWSYPTNRAILLVTAAVLVGVAGWGAVRGQGLDGLYAGFGAALATFFGWAVTRELDPDRELAAFLGAGLALALWHLLPGVDLAAMFWLLLVLRLANRCPGRTPRVFDLLTVLGLTGWGAVNDHPEVGLWAAFALLVDALGGWGRRMHFVAAALAVVMVPFGAAMSPAVALDFGSGFGSALLHSLLLPFAMLVEGVQPGAGTSGITALALAAGAVLFGCRCLLLPLPTSLGDGDRTRLDPRRVGAARLLVVLVVVSSAAPEAGTWLLGSTPELPVRVGLASVSPAAAAGLAVVLWPMRTPVVAVAEASAAATDRSGV